ncbi:membrane protein, PF09925 family [Leptospira inadai serovar Lyme str. 10]|uniref:Membrane protein, PF09925 family n=2 Tax=Leptospira inadai serovar Lyme TaxID=293084 RepID=V6HGU7_9LEPT|nr:DUF2157 domain-containing protein [Leptospira inadai]EQA34920.1 membrane protein, PF09925 family [Leptospira inadai serovar Lyme str. 10]PNV75989.1 DUF2157 domain-containing protein [Leptospira inadai serovar Lyme]
MKNFEKSEAYEVIRLLNLDEKDGRKFLSLISPEPSLAEWIRFARIGFLALGSVLFASGVIFFFAYNWAGMDRFAKLGLIAGSLSVVSIASFFIKKEYYSYQALLFTAVILTGVLLAVYGQIYQTGANSVDLFISWTILSLGFVAVGNSAFLWLFWIVLLNSTIQLYGKQILFRDENPYLYSLALLINLGFIAAYELTRNRSEQKETAAWFPNAVGVIAFYFVIWGSIFSIFRDQKGIGDFIMIGMSILFAVGIYFVYRRMIRRLGMLAIALLSGITLIFSIMIRQFDWDNFILLFFFGGVVLTAVTAWSAKHLINVRNEWRQDERKG